MYEHLHSLELAFFDGQQTGQLMSRATVDLQAVRFFLGYGLIFIVQSLLTIVIAAAVMFAVDPGLAAVSLAPMPFVIWIAFRYGRLNRPATQEVQQRIAELTAEVEENVGGVRVVKAFAQEERQLRRFDGAVARVFDQSMVSTRLRAFYAPLIGFVPQLGLAGLLFVGGHQAINGSLDVGEFVAFYGYVLLLTSPMRMLGMALGMAQRAVASGARVFELLDREPTLTAPGGAHAPAERRRAGRAARRDLRLRRRRAGAARRRPGRGARPHGGARGAHRIGQDHPRDARAAALRRPGGRGARGRRGRALASTRPCCAARWPWFPTTPSSSPPRSPRTSRTPAPTRAMPRSGAPPTRAGLSEVVDDLPEGLETLVGERGHTLSGGQRQRVAIARALLAEPRILILDDATSSVDATTESRIKSALAEVMKGRTTFVIAHRLSTIALADEVVVLEDGEIVARGTHDELLEDSPLYREIAEKGLPGQVFLTRDDPEREVAGL